MKTQILLALTLAAPVFASAKSVDCSKATEGTVTIQVSKARLSSEQAIQEAFVCFSQLNQTVQTQVQAAKDQGALDIGTLGYVCNINNVQSIEISSDHIQNPAKGEATTETLVLVSQSADCTSVGSGQAQTNLRSAQFLVQVNEAISGVLSGKIKQDLTVKLLNPVDLNK